LSLATPTALTAAPPKLNYLFPAGLQRGQTVAITASGEFGAWPVQVWVDRPGLTITCEADKGKLQVAAAADAIPGVYWLRLFDGEGATSLKPLVVGTLPEVIDAEPNDLPHKPQAVEPRVVVNGKLAKNGDVDGYRVELKQGQTLVASVQGHSVLGSPMDSVLQLCELVERNTSSVAGAPPRIEAFTVAQNHDATGLDPQVVFTAPKDAAYVVRLFAFPAEPNSTIAYSGAETYVYRLTLTSGGYFDRTLPLALPADAAGPQSPVQLLGWSIPDAARTLQVPPPGASANPLLPVDEQVEWLFHPDLAGAIAVPRVPHPSVVAADTSDPAQPQDVAVPCTISGQLETPRDADAFVFAAAKGQKLRVTALGHSLGFPIDPFLAVLDESGKALAEVDDDGRQDRDPQLVFTSPADGRYRVVVRDLAHLGGPRFCYRVTIEPALPDYALSLAADSFVLAADKPLEIPVTIDRRDGQAEAIEIRAEGLPPGVTAEPVVSEPKGESAKSVKLVLKADPAAIQPGGSVIRITGQTKGDSPLVRTARFPLNLPLTQPHGAAWLTVRSP
jgi:hypothetical protein